MSNKCQIATPVRCKVGMIILLTAQWNASQEGLAHRIYANGISSNFDKLQNIF